MPNAKGAPGTHKLHVVGLQSFFFFNTKYTQCTYLMRTANPKGDPGTHKLHVVGLQSCFVFATNTQ